MLSKYYEQLDEKQVLAKGDIRPFAEILLKRLQLECPRAELVAIRPGGTLGIFFEARLDGKKQFIKTHPFGRSYQENILKEIELMSGIYGHEMVIKGETIELHGQELTFMRMDYLKALPQSLKPEEICRCVDNYQKRLSKQHYDVKYRFEEVIKAGWDSRELLYTEKCLSKKVYEQLGEAITCVEKKFPLLPQVICHGDLSQKNLMCNENGQVVVIDWEDALLAFPVYDFLCWLTFFPQRNLYKKGLLEEYGISMPFGVHVMALIILVKCGLSYRSGSYVNDSISFNERLGELYDKLM